jgi:hypothetical protein
MSASQEWEEVNTTINGKYNLTRNSDGTWNRNGIKYPNREQALCNIICEQDTVIIKLGQKLQECIETCLDAIKSVSQANQQKTSEGGS